MRIFLFLVCTLFSTIGFAQVNIEKKRERKSKPVVVEMLVSHSSTKGNVNVSQFNTSGRVDYTRETVHAFALGSYLTSEDGQSRLQQEAFGHLRFTYMPSLIGIDLFTQAEYNPFKALSLRQLNGAYARVEFLSTGIFAIGFGGMSDYEKLSEGISDGLVARGTSYVSYSYENELYEASFTGYYQPKLFELSDYRLTAEAFIEIKLSDLFSVVEQFTYMYDSAPPTGVRVDDRRNTTSLKIRW